jgi:hypothetical protein
MAALSECRGYHLVGERFGRRGDGRERGYITNRAGEQQQWLCQGSFRMSKGVNEFLPCAKSATREAMRIDCSCVCVEIFGQFGP